MTANTGNAKISLEELRRMVGNPKIKDSELIQYFILDERSRGSFQPRILPNPATVDLGSGALDRSLDFEATLIETGIGLANSIARARRHLQYSLTTTLFPGIQRIVSEGDSWFQYPLLLLDVIDQLNFPAANYAIYSLGAGGDLLKDLVAQSEIVTTLETTGADILLLSGGGNDLLGEASGKTNIQNLLNEFNPNLKPEDYLNENFNTLLREVIDLYRNLLEGLTDRFSNLKILCHGYDYIVPVAGGPFLGNPMVSKGITDPSLQQAIMKIVVDRLNEEQIALIENIDRVFHIDCRGAVNENQWHDEIHPTNAGYGLVAGRFEEKIKEIAGSSASANPNRILIKNLSPGTVYLEFFDRGDLAAEANIFGFRGIPYGTLRIPARGQQNFLIHGETKMRINGSTDMVDHINSNNLVTITQDGKGTVESLGL